MKEINDYCPRCNQYRLLRSINYLDDRRHVIIISRDVKYINYLCYNCLSEIDKGIKDGRGLVELVGRDFIIQGYALPKYIEEIYKMLRIDRQIISKSYDFIIFVYTRWIEIQPEEKFKYHLASLMMGLHQSELEDKKRQLGDYINNHFTNTSIEEINEKINEITIWCQEKNYNPFSA